MTHKKEINTLIEQLIDGKERLNIEKLVQFKVFQDLLNSLFFDIEGLAEVVNTIVSKLKNWIT